MTQIDLVARPRTLSPREFVQLKDSDRRSCVVQVVAPRLGKRGFGGLAVISKTPHFFFPQPLAKKARRGKKALAGKGRARQSR